MAVSRKAMTEGIRTAAFPSILNNAPLQSLSQKSKIFASSLYTREPGVLPHQYGFRWFAEESGDCEAVCALPRNDMFFDSLAFHSGEGGTAQP